MCKLNTGALLCANNLKMGPVDGSSPAISFQDGSVYIGALDSYLYKLSGGAVNTTTRSGAGAGVNAHANAGGGAAADGGGPCTEVWKVKLLNNGKLHRNFTMVCSRAIQIYKHWVSEGSHLVAATTRCILTFSITFSRERRFMNHLC